MKSVVHAKKKTILMKQISDVTIDCTHALCSSKSVMCLYL